MECLSNPSIVNTPIGHFRIVVKGVTNILETASRHLFENLLGFDGLLLWFIPWSCRDGFIPQSFTPGLY